MLCPSVLGSADWGPRKQVMGGADGREHVCVGHWSHALRRAGSADWGPRERVMGGADGHEYACVGP